MPTVQHKAGLAGLVMFLDWMQETKRLEPSPIVKRDDFGVELRLTESLIVRIFNELYSGTHVEVKSKKKWPAKFKPVRVEEENQQRRFVYSVVQPLFPFLTSVFPDELWLKLWRDMCWSTIRAIDKTRLPYKKTTDKQSSGEGERVWRDLVTSATSSISGAIFVGAQATNAELVYFEGTALENLVLHFWLASILVFCPRALNKEGTPKSRGYLIAFPEVTDLGEFVRRYREVAQGLESRRVGYRPSGCLLDIAAESALRFFSSLSAVAASQKRRIFAGVSSIEYFHMEKQGNSVKCLEVGKVTYRSHLAEQYELLSSKHVYRSYLFRRGLISALLMEQPWYLPFSKDLQERPDFLLLDVEDRKGKRSREGYKFANDCAQKFNQLIKKRKEVCRRVSTTTQIETIVYRLVRDYLRERALASNNQEWGQFPKDDKGRVRPDARYYERIAHLGRSLFLELRARREQKFIEHFSATLGSVGQFLPERDYMQLVRHLRENPEDTKTLTLLALSANTKQPRRNS